MTLTAISIDRYFIISKPIKARTIYTDRKMKLIVSAIWLISVIIMSPLLFIFKFESKTIYTDLNNSEQHVIYAICFENWPQFETKLLYEILLIIFLFILPSMFMSYAYISVSRRLWFFKNRDTFEQSISNHANDFIDDNDNDEEYRMNNFTNAGEKRQSSLDVLKSNNRFARRKMVC